MVKQIEYPDGTIHYKNENGELHREDGPAMILPNETKKWYQNDKIHRNDGPAIIWIDGGVDWFLKGRICSFKEWCELVDISDEEKMELGLKYG